MRILPVLGSVLFLASLLSCKRPSASDASINASPVDLRFTRFEYALFQLNPDSMEEGWIRLAEQTGEFANLFTHQVIGIGGTENPLFYENLKAFITDYTIQEINEEVIRLYPIETPVEKELEAAFGRYAFMFNSKVLPRTYTFIAGLNQSIVTSDSLLAIGIDKYLGAENEIYTRAMVPQYLRRGMNPSDLVKDAMKGWLLTEHEKNDSLNHLLSHMIYQGKIVTVLQKIFPTMTDTALFGYSPDQIQWLLKNEKQMWMYLVENKLLYNSETRTLRNFIDEAPFTKDFTQESPGKAAIWTGYRIVKGYLERNNTNVQALMNASPMVILEESRYDP